MLTARGWWFLLIVLFQTSMGVLLSERGGLPLAMVGITLLAWFGIEWALFTARVTFSVPKIRIRRELLDERKAIPILWSGREFEVRIHIWLESRLPLPFVIVEEILSHSVSRMEGDLVLTTALSEGQPEKLRYRIFCSVPGEVLFEGVRLRLADSHGFFYHRAVIRQQRRYPVLPPLMDLEGTGKVTKRHNIFPPPGAHRLRRPGGGGELLDLRDYRPGDAPKMIAWKASARRDKLITKEFETEVPLRCTICLDASASVRIGPPRETMLMQMVQVAAGVTQAASAERDHVGLVVFDEERAEILPANRNRRHLIEMMQKLANAAARPMPVAPQANLDDLMDLSYPLAHEIYPDLMDDRINRTPFGMFWSHVLDYRRGWLFLFLLMPMALLILGAVSSLVGYLVGSVHPMIEYLEFLNDVYMEVGWRFPVVMVSLMASLAGLIRICYGLTGLLSPWNRERKRRKQLALFWAAIDPQPVDAIPDLIYEDAPFIKRAQQFLRDHQIRYPLELYDDKGCYQFRSPAKVKVLADALLRMALHSRDNELFVIAADLVELDDDLAPLQKAIAALVGRHHRVIILCPWPSDLPPPPKEIPEDAPIEIRKTRRIARSGMRAIRDEIEQDTISLYHRGYLRLRKVFGRMGVLILRIDEKESVELILERLQRMRFGGSFR